MPYHNQGSRFLCDVLQTSKNSPVFWLTFLFQYLLDSFCSVTFYVLPRLFLFFFWIKSPSAHWAFKSVELCAVEMDIIIIRPKRSCNLTMFRMMVRRLWQRTFFSSPSHPDCHPEKLPFPIYETSQFFFSSKYRRRKYSSDYIKLEGDQCLK